MDLITAAVFFNPSHAATHFHGWQLQLCFGMTAFAELSILCRSCMYKRLHVADIIAAAALGTQKPFIATICDTWVSSLSGAANSFSTSCCHLAMSCPMSSLTAGRVKANTVCSLCANRQPTDCHNGLTDTCVSDKRPFWLQHM